MIVTLTFPSNISQVRYGQATFATDDNHQIDLPDYIAKTLLTLDGVTGPTLVPTAAALLAAIDAEFEANYLFFAYGKAIPASNKTAAAINLMTSNGVPTVSMS